jgi:hypothetical protein
VLFANPCPAPSTPFHELLLEERAGGVLPACERALWRANCPALFVLKLFIYSGPLVATPSIYSAPRPYPSPPLPRHCPLWAAAVLRGRGA